MRTSNLTEPCLSLLISDDEICTEEERCGITTGPPRNTKLASSFDCSLLTHQRVRWQLFIWAITMIKRETVLSLARNASYIFEEMRSSWHGTVGELRQTKIEVSTIKSAPWSRQMYWRQARACISDSWLLAIAELKHDGEEYPRVVSDFIFKCPQTMRRTLWYYLSMAALAF